MESERKKKPGVWIWCSLLIVSLLAASGCSDTPERRGGFGIVPALVTGFIGPRTGYSMNEGRRLRTSEWFRAIPGIHVVPAVMGGVVAYKGRTANLDAWAFDLDPPAVRQEWVDVLDQCREEGLLSEKEYKTRLNLLARGNYTHLKLLRKARDENAVSDEDYAVVLRRLLEEPDWALNPLNDGILQEAVKSGVLTRAEAVEEIRQLVKKEVPSFYVLKTSYELAAIDFEEYKRRVRRLYERVYE